MKSKASKIGKIVRGIAVASAAALFLSACSSAAADTESETTGDGLAKIRVGALPFGFEAVEIAQREGIFEAHGLEVESSYDGAGATSQITKAISGELDIAASGSTNVIAAIGQGFDVKIVGASQSADPNNPGNDGLIVPGDSPIQSLSDLEGSTVAIAGLGNLPQVITNIALDNEGVDWESVTFVTVPNESQQEAALNGQVDAILPVQIFHAKAMSEGFRTVGGSTADYFPDTPQIVWVASSDFVSQHGDILEKFNAAMQEANEFGNANPDAVRDIDRELTQMPEGFIANRSIDTMDVHVDRSAVKSLADYMFQFGLVEQELTVDEIVWENTPE